MVTRTTSAPGVPGPMDLDETDDYLPTGARRCTANSARAGRRCKQPAIAGSRVCRIHGGSAPQVRRAARLRLAELVDPAIGRLARIVVQGTDRDAIRAIENVLDRAGHPRRSEVDVELARAELTDALVRVRDAAELAAHEETDRDD